MRALFDVNALLAVFDSQHTFHATVRDWWATHADRGWATCPLTQNGFVRIMSQPRYQGHRSPQEAAAILHAGLSQPAHDFWPDDLTITDPAVFDHTRILGSKQLTDIYLLTLAAKNGGRLVTLDRTIPLAAVHGAKPENLVVL